MNRWIKQYEDTYKTDIYAAQKLLDVLCSPEPTPKEREEICNYLAELYR